MGHIPDEIPETGSLSIEARSASLVITGPVEHLVVHADGEHAHLELDWADLPALRACIDHALWVRRGSQGRPFQGVPMAFEVHGGGQMLALVPTEGAADRLATAARRLGADPVLVRPLTAFMDPGFSDSLEQLADLADRSRAAEAARTFQLALRSLGERLEVSFATMFEGHISGAFYSQRVVAIDADKQAFRVNGVGEWIRVETVRFAHEGLDPAFAAATADPDDLTEDEITARMAGTERAPG